MTPREIALSILAQLVAERSRVVVAEPDIAIAIDPICGMEVAAVETSLHADIDGTRYYFCSEGCRDTFLAEAGNHAAAG